MKSTKFSYLVPRGVTILQRMCLNYYSKCGQITNFSGSHCIQCLRNPKGKNIFQTLRSPDRLGMSHAVKRMKILDKKTHLEIFDHGLNLLSLFI